MKTKRFTAIMVVMAMIASMIILPNFASAAYSGQSTWTESPERGDYGYTIIGTSSNLDADDMDVFDATSPSTQTIKWGQDRYLWIGVTLSDLNTSRLSATQTMAALNGMTNFQASILYDNKYLTFPKGSTAKMLSQLATRSDVINAGAYEYTGSYSAPFSQSEYAALDAADTGSAENIEIAGSAAEPVSIAAGNRDTRLEQASLTLEHVTGDMAFSGTLDGNEHLIMVFALQMTGEVPEANQVVVQGFSNHLKTTMTIFDTTQGYTPLTYSDYYDTDLAVTGDPTMDAVMYAMSGQMSYYFNTIDNIPSQQRDSRPEGGGSGTKADDSVDPTSRTYDKNENYTEHFDETDSSKSSKTYEYSEGDVGGLARLVITGPSSYSKTVNFTNSGGTITSDTTGVTATSSGGITTVVFSGLTETPRLDGNNDPEVDEFGNVIYDKTNGFLDGLADGEYTIEFVPVDSTADYHTGNKTATLTVKKTVDTVKVKIVAVPADGYTLASNDTIEKVTYNVPTENEYGNIVDTPTEVTPSGTFDFTLASTTQGKIYDLKPGETYTIHTTYNEAVKWAIEAANVGDSVDSSTAVGNPQYNTSVTPKKGTADLVIGDTDPNASIDNYYIVKVKFGLAEPTLTTTATANGSVTVKGAGGTADPTETSSPYTLAKNGQYTITAVPDAGYKFKTWKNATGDLASITATSNPVTFTATAEIDSSIEAEFEALQEIDLTVDFDPNDSTKNNKVEVHEDTATGTLKATLDATNNTTKINELTKYVLVPVPSTANGYRFSQWDNDNTATGNYTIADTTTANVSVTAKFVTKEDPDVTPKGSPTPEDYDKNGGTGLTFYYKPGGVVSGTEEYPLKDIVIKTATGSPITIATTDCTIGNVETTGDHVGYKSVFIPASKLNVASGIYTFTFENDDDYNEPVATVKIRNSVNDNIVITTPPTDMEYVHGDKIDLDGTVVTVSYETTSGTTTTVTHDIYTFKNATTAGAAGAGWYKKTAVGTDPAGAEGASPESTVPFKVYYSSTTSGTPVEVKHDEDIMRYLERTGANPYPSYKDNGLVAKVTESGHAIEGTTSTVTTDKIIVERRPITYTATFENATGKVKEYNGTTALKNGVAPTYTTTGTYVTYDVVDVATNQITSAYASPNVNWTGTTEGNVNIVSTIPTAAITGADKDNYTFSVDDVTDGKITQATINISAINNIPDAKVGVARATGGTSSSAVVAEATDATATNAVTTDGSIYSQSGTKDSITLNYNWSYTAPAQSDINSAKSYAVTLADTSLDNTNYKLGTVAAGVNVVDKEFDSFTLNTAPTLTYNYSDKFDLGSFKITVNYKDGAPADVFSNVAADVGTTDSATGQTIQGIPAGMTFSAEATASTAYSSANQITNGTTEMTVNGHDDKYVIVSYNGHETSVGQLDVSPLQIKITPTGTETKEYDGTTTAQTSSVTAVPVSIDGTGKTIPSFYETTYAAKLIADVVTADTTAMAVAYDNKNTSDRTVTPHTGADHLVVSGLDFTVTAGVDKSNYTLVSATENTAAESATITKRPLSITSITNIKAVDQYSTGNALKGTAYHGVNGGATGKATVAYAYAGSVPGQTMAVASADTVELTFDYAYDQTTVGTDPVITNPTDVAISNIAFDNTMSGFDNYTVVTTGPATGTGVVTPVTIGKPTLTIPNHEYTYIDNDKLSLNGAEVTFTKGATTIKYTASEDPTTHVVTWTPSDGTGATTTPPFTLHWGSATGTDVSANEDVNPKDHNTKIYAVHSNGTASDGTEITVAKKKLTYVNATASGAITKVYNGNNNLLDSSKALITYTAGYKDGTNDQDVTKDADNTDIVVTSTPTYPDIHANGANITGVTVPSTNYTLNFTAPTMTTNPYYELDTGVTVASTLTGTITKRALNVTVKDDVTASSITVDDGPTSKKVALKRADDFTIELATSPVNTDETNAVVTGDWDNHLTIAVEAEYTDFTKGAKTIEAANVTNTNGGDYLEDYTINFTSKAVSGNVTANDYAYTVTTSNATVAVTDDAVPPSTVAPNTAGGTVWSLSQASTYTVTVTPAAGYVFDSWSNVTGPTGFAFTGTTAAESFKMPKGNVSMTANMKLLPKWNTTPTAIDRSKDLSFKVDSDFVPDTIKIGTLTLDNTKFTANKSGSTYTIGIDKSELAGLPDAPAGSELTLEVDFTGLPTWAPADSNKLTADVTVSNNASKTVVIDNVSYTQPTGQVYGDKLNLDTFTFNKTIKQTNESDIVYNYLHQNGGWYKKLSTDANYPATAMTAAEFAADGLTIAWSSTGMGTPEHNTTVLKHTVHNQDPELVVKYDSANDTGLTNVTGAPQTVSAGKLNVGQKELTVTVSATGISKVYDATDAIDESGQTTNKDKITVNVANTVDGDTITPTISSAKFLDKASGSKAKDVDTDKPVEVKYTLAGGNAAEYKIGTVTDITANPFTNNTSVTGAVTKRDVTITKVTFPSKSATATDGLTTGITNQLFKDVVGVNLTLQTGDQVYGNDGNELQVTLSGSYPDLDLEGAANKVKTINPYTHDIKDKGSVVTAANYNFIWPADASGTVTGRTIQSIAVTKQPKYTVNKTAPDNKADHGTALDLADLEVTITYVDDNDDTTVDTKVVPWSAAAGSDWANENLTLAWDGGNTTNATPTTNGSTLRHDTNDDARLKVTISGSSVAPAYTDLFDIGKKTVTVHAVANGITKVYDGKKDLPSDVGTLTAVIDDATGVIADDAAAIIADNIEITNVEYAGFHKNNAHDIVTKDKATLEASSFKWKSGVTAGENYDFVLSGSATVPTGEITAKKITITKIAIDPVYVNDSGTKIVKDTPANGIEITSSSITKTGSPIDGDTIKIKYKASYTDEDSNPDTSVEKDPYEVILKQMAHSVTTSAIGSVDTDYEIEWPNGTGDNSNKKVGIGAVKGKTVDTATISSDITLYHGQTLDLTGTKIHVKFTDTEEDDYVYSKSATNQRGWFKGTDAANVTGEPLTLPGGLNIKWLSGSPETVTEEVLRYDDASGRFTAGTGVKTGTIGLYAGATQKGSITVSINPRPVTLTITGGIEKTYDGTDSAVAAAGINNTVSTANYAFTAGNDSVGGIVQTGTPLAYELSVDETNTTVKFARVPAHDGTVTGSEIYANVTPVYNDAAIAACYDITVVNHLTSKINKRPLTVTGQEVEGKKKIPSVMVGDPTRGKLELNNNEYTWDQATPYAGLVSTGGTSYEQVILEYDYDFGTNGTDTAGNKTVTIPASDPTATPAYVNPRIKNSGSGEVGANYELTFTPSTDGKVSNKNITGITVTEPNKKTYAHGDELDLTGLAITLTYEGGSTETFTYTGTGATATDDWTWDKALPSSIKSIDWANADAAAPLSKNDTAVQRYDSNKLNAGHNRTINIVYQNEGDSEVTKPVTTITVEQKKISTINIGFADTITSVDKPYDTKSDADATKVKLTPVGVLNDDTVKVNADLFYANNDTATKAVNANAEPDFTLLAGATAYDIQGENVVLPAKTADDNNDCYILDPAGVTFTTTATGKIRQLEIDVTKYPVTAAVKDASAASPLVVHMQVQEIGSTDDRIQINEATHDGSIMPAADKTAFLAEYYVTYPVNVLNETDTDLTHVFFSTAAGVATTDKPTVSGITTSNYIFNWPNPTGSLVDNAISGLDTNYSATFYHGDKLNFGADYTGSNQLEFTVTYSRADSSTYDAKFRAKNDGSWEKSIDGGTTYTPVVSLVAEGIELEWTNTTEPNKTAAQNDILRFNMHQQSGVNSVDTITIKARSTDASAVNGYISKQTKSITIKPLPIYAAVTKGDLEKVYNGDKKLEASDLADVKFDTFYDGKTEFIGPTATPPSDYDNTLGDDISIDKTGIEYASEDVNLTGTTDAPVIGNVDVKLPEVAAALTGANKANYEFKGFILKYNDTGVNQYNTVTTLDGKITQKPLDIEITGVPSIKASLPDSDRVATQLTSDYYTITGIVGSDDVDANIWYKYPEGNANLNPTINLKGADKTSALADHAQTDLTGTKAKNYDPTFHPASVTGTIEKATINNLSVSGPTKTDYVHGDNANLIGLRVQADTTDPSVKYDFEFNVDTYGDNPGWRQFKANGYDDNAGDQAYPTLSAAVQAAGLADVITLNLVGAAGGTAGTPVSGGLTDGGTLRHNVHDQTAFYATTGSLSDLSDDIIEVDTKKVYASVAVENGKYVEKLYDATSPIGSDESSVENKTKLVYTLLEKVDNTGTFATDYQALVPLAGETVTPNSSGVAADFVDDNNNKRSDVHGTWSPSLTSFGLFSVNRSRADILPWDIDVTGLAINDNNMGNYEFVGIVGDKPEGKIYPGNVTVTASKVADVYADAEGNELTVDVLEWTATGFVNNTDKNDISFSNWKATYDLSKDPATVTVNTNKDTITIGAASGASDANAWRNYDYTFAGSPTANVKPVQPASIVINTQPDFAEANPPAQHGTKISDAGGWDNLEFTITYTSGKTTKHKRTTTGWVTSDGYDVPPADVTFTWSNTNALIGDLADIDDLPLLRPTGTQTNTNQIIISAPGVAEPASTKPVKPEKKKVKVKVEGKYEKDYDGTPDVNLDDTTPEITFTIDPTDIVPDDNVTVKTPPTLTFTTPDVSDENPINIGNDAELSNENYEIEIDDTTGDQVFVTDDDFEDSAIKAKKIKVTITVPTITSGGTAEVEGTIGYATTADTTNGSFATTNANDIAERDKANIRLTYSGTRETVTNTGSDPIETNVTLDPDIPTVSGTGINPANYVIETATATGSVDPSATPTRRPSSGGGGGGGGSTNSLTIHYENEDGTAGEEVSKISVPLGTEPTDLIGVIKTKIKDMTVLWTSDNEKVATVDENGVVTYVGEGTATITAQSKQTKSLKDTVVVTVTAEQATPAPTEKPDDGDNSNKRTHERVRDSLITKTMLNPYIVGYDDYVFGPELPISREELAAIFARLIANNLYMDKNYDTSFPDVPEKWSKSYIGYLEGFDVVKGYEDGLFRPEQNITRAEMAVMMAKAEGYDITPDISASDLDFPDVDEGYATWSAAKAIQILSDLGIMSGYTDGTFRPGQPITRAETVATVNRVLAAQEVADRDVLPSDVTDAHWAYEDIVFSMNHRILKDAAADPNAFIWSEEFDKNMIRTTEKVNGTKEVIEGEEASEDETSDGTSSDTGNTGTDTEKKEDAETPKSTDKPTI